MKRHPTPPDPAPSPEGRDSARIVIIDDDELLCEVLCRHFTQLGHDCVFATRFQYGLELVVARPADVVFLDVRLPDANGVEALPLLRRGTNPPEVIIFTAQGDPDGAETAIRGGAWDYVEKPASIKEMTLPLLWALQYRREKIACQKTVLIKREGIIGASEAITNSLNQAARAAATDAGVLICGETGTGKELFARAIHDNSLRAAGPFVVVDCAALPPSLAPGILFGHTKGAFTGAETSREGLVRLAAGGTLFLDEVGELPLDMQKSFLRVVQERRFRPLGAKAEVESNFRLVAATNRDLEAMAAAGSFRADLLFRLRTLTMVLPPLRERDGDIAELARYHLERIYQRSGLAPKQLAAGFLPLLGSYGWPGNVRELVNALEEAIANARHELTLFPRHLPLYLRIHTAKAAVTRAEPDLPSRAEPPPPRSIDLPPMKAFREKLLAANEKAYLAQLITQTSGNIQEACRISGLGRARLYSLLKAYDLKVR